MSKVSIMLSQPSVGAYNDVALSASQTIRITDHTGGQSGKNWISDCHEEQQGRICERVTSRCSRLLRGHRRS